MTMRPHAVIFLVVVMALLGGVIHLLRPASVEPVWHGHRLSKWLDMYDSSLRFEAGDGRHPRFTDEEFGRALDGIGTNALPFVREWLLQKPDRIKPWFNGQLNKLNWLHFRFAVDYGEDCSRAETGFLYYGVRAQLLLPWLMALSHSADPDLRMTAYEAAFFRRPEKAVFLPLADRALSDEAAGCEATAAQWMVGRFPEEAARRNLRSRYPQFYHDWSEVNTSGTSSSITMQNH